MFGWTKFFRRNEIKSDAHVGLISVHTRPLMLNPDFSDNLKQKMYRMDAIERYVTQRREENRPIQPVRMAELEVEYQRLQLDVRQLQKQFIADGGVL